MKKVALKNVSQLLQQVQKHDIEFVHQGESYQTEIYVKSLSYAQTEPLYKRLATLQNDDDLVADWISQVVVDEKGKNFLTPDDVKNTFPQMLAMTVFNKVVGIEDVQHDKQGKSS